jgi:hypothetical protein
MSYERMLDKECKPTGDEMLKWVGKRAVLWSDLTEYLASRYEHVPELDFGGKKYGWSLRYRKNSKTLLTLFPECGGFTALVVLGKKEVVKAEAMFEKLSKRIQKLFQETNQLHDGRWLWIRPSTKKDVESIKILLNVKHRPKCCKVG